MYRFLAEQVTSKAKLVLGLIAAITIYMSFGLAKLETRNNDDADLPKDDPIVQTNDRLESVFGGKDIVMIGIRATDTIYRPNTLKKIAAISRELENVSWVIRDEVTSLSTVSDVRAREWGLESGPLMPSVPTTPAALERLRQDVRNNPLIHGRLVSKDDRSSLIVANIREGYDQGRVTATLERLANRYGGPETIVIGGNPVYSQYIDKGIERDSSILAPLAFLLQAVGFWVFFRTARGVGLPFLLIVISTIWTMGGMGHAGVPLNVVTSSLPVLMAAVASTYGIHMVQRYYEELATGKSGPDAARDSAITMSHPVVITGLTSSLGAATLATFRVVAIAEFGIISAVGNLIATVLAITLIPAALMLLPRVEPPPVMGSVRAIQRWLDRTALFSLRRWKGVLAGCGVALVISVVGIARIRAGADFVEYFPKGHPMRSTFAFFNESFGGARYFNIMIDGGTPDAVKDPELLRKIWAFQKYAETLPGVSHTTSFADTIRRLSGAMNGGAPGSDRIPESRDVIAQYLLLYAMSGDPGEFGDQVDYDFQRAKIKVMVTTGEQDDHKRIYAALRSYAEREFGKQVHVEFGGLLMLWLAQMKYIVTGKIQNIIYSVLTILVLCIFIFRSIRGGIFSIVPLTLSTLLTFGVMGFFGIRLEVGTAIITSVAVGIGVDFAIHYLERYRVEAATAISHEEATLRTMSSAARGIAYGILSNLLGFVVFVFSGFLPLQYFGWLICLTMITVGYGTFVIVPALLIRFGGGFAPIGGAERGVVADSGLVESIPTVECAQ